MRRSKTLVRLCLFVPAFACFEDAKRTLACVDIDLLQEGSVPSLYFEGGIPEGVDLSFGTYYTPETIQALEFAVSKFDAEDLILTLFAGDTFSSDALQAALDAMTDADYASVYGNGGAFISVFRQRAFHRGNFFRQLAQSCICLSDTIKSAVRKSVVSCEVTVDENINSLCFDVDKMDFPAEKRRVWAFCAGQYSNDFRGNPKYLFLYLNNYRTDIMPYWLCNNEEVILLIRRMGMYAFQLGSVLSELVINRTGVLVSEQVKASIPAGLEDAVYLNLWHGVGGVKAVERSMLDGQLAREIAIKYIKYNAYFRTNEMYLAPSEFIEGIAREQLGLEAHQIVRCGYPRNIYQRQYKAVSTFFHRVFRHPELPEDTRFAAYIPTYRNNQRGDLFAAAIPDMEKLIEVCRENHICMILKMHPILESELSFKQAKAAYADCPWVYFWDNRHDFYEVMDQMDLCIFDYSSMFTDFIAAGCKHFLRYAFDFTCSDLDFPMDYDEATLGRKCTSFGDLLQALADYTHDDLSADIQRISNLYWMHAGEDSMDRIVSAVLAFEPVKQELPTLYSFDIFDTLLSRRVLAPEGIFYRVQERMRESGVSFPNYLLKRYPFIRHNAELNMREYYNRSKVERNDERCEIQFEQIMKRIQVLYELTDEQTALLAQWEIEAELDDVLPLNSMIDRVKKLLAAGETVVLISDMYLPGDVIRQMLAKADPVLAELPLYLSSERGYQKSASTLFLEVYRDYAPDYRFGKWIHTGDNAHSDVKVPRSLNIETIPAHRTDFNKYEAALAEALQSYDGYLIAASMARFREEHPSMQEQFAYSYISLLFVPYVHWAMNSCKSQGKKNVYLIARDGHQLKRIADVVNDKEQLGLNTKYFYASRRVWRIPSFFDHIDVGFWGQGYGNLAKVDRFSKLLKALDMDEPTFRQMFPELQSLNEETVISSDEIVRLAGIFKNSEKYLHYLLGRAEEQRFATCEYMKQEMDLNEPFSVIEYWGRGYTQENFTRLWQHVCGRKEPTTFYYSRSTLPSDEDNIRMNFTSHPSSQAFIESIFACINYKTIQSYQRINKKWMPCTEEIVCNQDLFYAMENYLPEFAADFCTLPMTDRATTGRNLIDFAISWYAEHPEWEGFTKVLSQLVDSVEMYGAKTQFANPLTAKELQEIEDGKTRAQVSKNISISYHCSEKDVQQRFLDMFQIREGEPLTSGWKISEDSIQRNKRAVKDLSARKIAQAKLQDIYNAAVRDTLLEDKIVVVTPGESFSEVEYGSLLNVLNGQTTYAVETVTLKSCGLTDDQLMTLFASAKYIISLAPVRQLCAIKLRPNSKLLIMGDTPVQLFLTGLLRKEALRDVKELDVFNLTNDISVIHSSSAESAKRAKHIYSVGAQTKILETGSIVTDCYFNKELRARLREELSVACPEMAGKKIIAYLPLFRYRNAASKYAYMLDMHKLQRELGDDYFVAMHLMGAAKEMSNRVEIPGFSRNVASLCSARALMLSADIIVADYRDTTFEAPLTGVPVFVTCGDKRNINRRDSIFTSFDKMIFGVPLNNTEDLISRLKDLDAYDDSYRTNFIEKYLTACDGHAAERVLASICEDVAPELLLPDIGSIAPKQVKIGTKAPKLNVCLDLDKETPVLYWEPVPGAEAYEVLACDRKDGAYRRVAVSKAESCVYRIREGLGRERWYCVRGLYQDKTVTGPCSQVMNGGTAAPGEVRDPEELQQIEAPQILFVIHHSKGNRLYWNGDDKCVAWRVRCTYSDGETVVLDHLHVNTWEWTDRDPRADKKATYTMSALYQGADGELIEGNISPVRKIDKVCDLSLYANKFHPEKFTLSWEPVANAKKYRLFRRLGTRGVFEFVGDLGTKKTQYSEEITFTGTAVYIMQAVTDKGTLVNRPVSVVVPSVLHKPTGLMVEKTEKGNVLFWNSAPNVDFWNIRLCTAENPAGKKIAEVPGNQVWWIDTVNTDDVSYRIEAGRTIGEGNQYSGYCKAVAKN